MVARLKLKGIDGRAPPGVEPAVNLTQHGKLTRSRLGKDVQIDSSLQILRVVVHGRS